MAEFVPVPNQRHAEPQPSKCSEKANHSALAEKNPDDLDDVCPERLHDSDFPPLLHRHRDKRAHNSECRDDHDEKQKEKHHGALETDGFEVLMVHVDPSLRELGWLEKLFNRLFYPLGAVRIVGLDRNTVQRVTQAVQLLTNINRNEQEFRVVQVMTGLKNAGDGQFLRQDHVAQLVDSFFFLVALRVLQFLNGIQDLAEITGRINCDLITNMRLQFPRKLDTEDGRFAFQIELAVFDELLQRDHRFLLRRIDAANHGREPPISKFGDHRALNVRRGRNYAGRVVDLRFERSPIPQNIVGAHENVRIEIDHFLAQLAVKPGHHRNHQNEHCHAEHHAQHGNQCDDGQESALGLQIPQCQEKTEGQFQIGDTVVANPQVFQTKCG